ncbi:zinc finger protein 37-like isoform X3 [Dreissena polymorpha]|nr:zinc finger protein 37-like isoform X3 [Dreissena polymorpha]XP_052245285.1 zinc finger protein 37-like isoform X3 [Dreissena polymorpha]
MMDEFASVKSIPGYEAVLKTVLKSQIKLLVDQLTAQTGEEVIMLTASLQDGSFTSLGSQAGNMFLDNNTSIKTQFYGFCMKEQDKTHGKRKSDSKAIPVIKKFKTPFESNKKQTPEKKDKPQIIIVPVQSSTPSVKATQPPAVSQSSQQPSPAPNSSTSTARSDTGTQLSQTFLYIDDTQGESASIVPFDEDIGDEGQDFLGMSDDEAGDPNYFEGQTPKVKVVRIEGSSAQGTTPGKSPDKSRRVHDYKYRYKSKAKPLPLMEHPIAPAASLSASLQAKLDRLHNTNKNSCEKCGKLFLREDQLEIHMRSHTAEAPFQCKHCGIQFRNKTNMNKHVRVQHGSEFDISL